MEEVVSIEALELLTVPDVASILRISPKSAWRLVSAGKLASIKVEGSRRVERQAVADYIQSLRKPAA